MKIISFSSFYVSLTKLISLQLCINATLDEESDLINAKPLSEQLISKFNMFEITNFTIGEYEPIEDP